MFENRVLRRIFGFKRNEITVVCRILHNEERHNLHSSTNTELLGWLNQGG
jgi:hypothetical protein